jgi:hypothetical protein
MENLDRKEVCKILYIHKEITQANNDALMHIFSKIIVLEKDNITNDTKIMNLLLL